MSTNYILMKGRWNIPIISCIAAWPINVSVSEAGVEVKNGDIIGQGHELESGSSTLLSDFQLRLYSEQLDPKLLSNCKFYEKKFGVYFFDPYPYLKGPLVNLFSYEIIDIEKDSASMFNDMIGYRDLQIDYI